VIKISITYCEYCDANIDLDFDCEHFDTEKDNESLDFCINEEQDIEMEIEKKKREFEVEK